MQIGIGSEGRRALETSGRRVAMMLVFAFALLGAWIPAAGARADLNSFFAGINGLLTFPADPVMDAMHPSEQIKGLPGTYSENAVGFAGGMLFGVYRAWMGSVDVALAPFWIFPTVSPPAHWNLFPFYEVEYE